VLQLRIRIEDAGTGLPPCRAGFNALMARAGTRWDSAAILQVIEDMNGRTGDRAACIPDRNAILCACICECRHLKCRTGDPLRAPTDNGFIFCRSNANEKEFVAVGSPRRVSPAHGPTSGCCSRPERSVPAWM